MCKKEKNELLGYLEEEVSEKFSVSFREAKKAVKASHIDELIDEIPDYFAHRSIDAWAVDVWMSYSGKIITV